MKAPHTLGSAREPEPHVPREVLRLCGSSVKALLRYSGAIKAVHCAIKALFRPYSGSVKALLRYSGVIEALFTVLIKLYSGHIQAL